MSEQQKLPQIKVVNLYRRENNGRVSWTGKVGSLTWVVYENSYKKKADDAEFVLYIRASPPSAQQQAWRAQGEAQSPAPRRDHPYAPKSVSRPPNVRNYAPANSDPMPESEFAPSNDPGFDPGDEF